MPIAAPIMESDIPVFPLLHSKMIESGRNNPRASASKSMLFAKRSLTLPLGLRNSHLANNARV